MAHKTVFPHLHVILLCEDYGSRLWPIAREEEPACAAPVAPGSSTTLLADTVQRLSGFTNEKIRVVTTLRMAHVIDGLLVNNCGLKFEQYELLTLPTQRGTAFSIALACARIRRFDPQAVVVVARTDQHVNADERWENALFDAYQVAMQDNVAVLGSVQETKCADWTYVRKGKAFPGVADTWHVKAFNAEQNPGVAKRICNQGAYWYTGTLMARAAVLMGELSHAGNQAETRESEGSHRIAETANFLAQIEPDGWLNVAAQEIIESLPGVSLDKALLEVSKNLVLVPTTLRFDALSCMQDLDALAEPTRDRNRVIGEAVLTRCKNTTVYAQGEKRKVVALGIKDAMIIELDDMTLVVSKDQLDNIDDARFDMGQSGQ